METAGVDEQLVVAMWERQPFDPAQLGSLGLHLIFRGVPSDAGGPDYQGALITRDDRVVVAGDVEFHVRSSDWYRHRHHENHRYNQVVLHVVWTDDCADTHCASGKSIPVLVVGPGADGSPSTSRPQPAKLLAHPCVNSYARLSGDELNARIREAGLARFSERAEAFAIEITALSADQAAYGALFQALGYASNRDTFRRLADIVPYAWLRSIPAHSWAESLLDAARLGPPAAIPPPGHLEADAWRLARIRPGNHPALRLRGAALLLEALGSRLADSLHTLVEGASRTSDLRQSLRVLDDGHGLIGTGRADELAVSVVLPFVSALEPLSDRARELYQHYPCPPSNRWTRIMRDLLFQAGHAYKPRAAPDHQGLHFLYHGFCRRERTARCPICAPHS